MTPTSTRTLGSLPNENPFRCDAEKVKTWEECEQQRIWRERIFHSRIPQRFRGAKIDLCDRNVKNWLVSTMESMAYDHTGNWLLLSGPNGTGKTYQACACAIQAAKEMGVEFSTMEEIVLQVQGTFGGSGNADKIVKRYQRVPFLVIDEIEKFKATEWSAPLVFAVLNGRYGNRKPTVITTNFTGDKMYQALAEGGGKELAASLLSRLADRSNTHITLGGEDRRLS